MGALDVFEESLLGLEVVVAGWALEGQELCHLFEMIFAADEKRPRPQLDISPYGG